MFKKLFKTFLRGLIAIIPLVLTISIVWWLLVSAENIFKSLISLLLPEKYYLPGLGLAVAILTTFSIGVLTRSKLINKLFETFEVLLEKLPLVRTIYSSIKDFTNFFSNQDQKFSKAVVVKIPNSEQKVLGFITSDHPESTIGDTAAGLVAVYLPMSYQLGGYTILLPKDDIETIDTSIEDSLRYILTAGVSQKQ